METLPEFFSRAHQMNVIERWNNKPNLLSETVAAHSYLVAMLAWGLAETSLLRGERIQTIEAVKRALVHDLPEVVTGDILSPTKRAARTMERAVEQLERRAGRDLVGLLPPEVRSTFLPYLVDPQDESPEGRCLAAADLCSAFLKAWFEVQLGNRFHLADLERIRRRLAAFPDPGTRNLLRELDVDGEHASGTAGLGRFVRLLFSLLYVKRWNNIPSLAPSSVAAHSHLVALVAWVLTESENTFHGADLPLGDILRRALLFEAPKSITGDILYHSKTATKTMERGVEIIRSRAAKEMLAILPAELRPAFAPYLQPLSEKEERIVEDAGLIAGCLEAVMEVRLGNRYFRPMLKNLLERADSSYPTTKRVLEDLRNTADQEERNGG